MLDPSVNWRTAWARLARPQAFGQAVEDYEKRALSQPFADPLSYVRQFAQASRSDPFRRAVWLEVEHRLLGAGAPSSPGGATARRLSPASLAAGLAFSGSLYGLAVAAVWMIRAHHP